MGQRKKKAIVPKPKGRQIAPTSFTRKRQAEFLALIAMGWAVNHAAKRVGIIKQTVYALRDRDEGFAAAYIEAKKEKVENLEQEAYQRAMGREEIIVGKNGEEHIVKKYSDLLMIFLLKAEKPDKYREKLDIKVSEERRIILDLLPVAKGEDGKLRLVEDTVLDVTPKLGEGD